MAYTYYYNDDGVCGSRSVTGSTSGCIFFSRNEYGWSPTCGANEYTEVYKETLTFTIESAAPVPINAYYSYTLRYDDQCTSNPDPQDIVSYVTIPAGQVSASVTYNCLIESLVDYGAGGCCLERQYMENPVFLDQPILPPECNDPNCTLAITGVTTTTPTQRGENDGTITVYLSGVTGTTLTYKLDGTTFTSSGPATGYTYTGISAGSYDILVLDGDCFDGESTTIYDGEFRTGDFYVQTPTNLIKAVENPIILELGTKISSGNPKQSINTFQITGSISNVIITFDLTFPYVYSAVFQSKGYPDRSTYFLESVLTSKTGVAIGSNTNEEISTSLAEVFQKDAIISRLYYITSSGDTVTLTSKDTASGYDLTAVNVDISGSNITLTNTQAGVAEYDGQLVENYSLYTELFIDENMEYGDTPDVANFVREIELELPFSRDNIHQFDLSSTLKNFVFSPSFDITFTGYTIYSDYIATYYCKYGEKYPLISNSNTKKKRFKGSTGFGYCCNAALEYTLANDMSDYFDYTGGTMLFLNTAPNNKYSHRDSAELLNFIIPKDYSYPISLVGNIYMYDGTSYTDIVLSNVLTGTSNNVGGLYSIAAGYEALGLSSYETGGEKIRKVELQLYQTISGLTGNTYSEMKSYTFEIDEQPDNFNVAFLNTLGTFETHTFIGELVEDQTIDRSEYQKPYDVVSTGAAQQGFEYNSILNTEFTKTYVVNTGWLNADNYYYVLGLLKSNKIYRYSDDTRQYLIPVSQIATKSTNNNEYSLQITFKETINVNNVTN